MRYLFIAEKPSLMREVQSCYRNHTEQVKAAVGEIDFTALAGHVCELYKPVDYEEWSGMKWREIQYPVIPQEWKIRGKQDKKDILNRIKSNIRKYDGIIVGTDSDVEGYGIYWMLEHFLHLEKYKTLRFVEHSLTDKEILQSLLTMTDYHTDAVHVASTNAYLVRSRADWLFGMNCSMMMSCKKNVTLRVGRVKAATLGIVYNNSMAIEHFKPEKYYQVEADYGTFQANLLTPEGTVAQFKERPQTSQYPLDGTVRQKKTKRSYEHAPKLFDLTTLQAEAGRVCGYTPAHTMEIVQSLYEKHKVISYPRTQCRYVSKEKAREFPLMLKHMSVFPDLAKYLPTITKEAIQAVMQDKQVVNDQAVMKESHDALLPTSKVPEPEKMTEEERNICHMIYTRLLSQFLPKTVIDKTTLVISQGDGLFGVSGRIIVEQGWRLLFKAAKDAVLPNLNEGDPIRAEKIEPAEKTTVPPKRLNQATLVYAMEHIANTIEDEQLKKTLAESQGIGTPATRAGIIKELLDSQYMEDKKGGLYITSLGKYYIESLDGIDIVSPVFAARLDLEMKKVQHQEETYENAYRYTLNELSSLCKKMGAIEQTNFQSPDLTAVCPKCGAKLTSRKYSYMCSACDFKVNKEIAGKKIDEKILNTILQGKTTSAYTFRKRDGSTFKASLALNDDGTVGFVFSGKGSGSAREKGSYRRKSTA